MIALEKGTSNKVPAVGLNDEKLSSRQRAKEKMELGSGNVIMKGLRVRPGVGGGEDNEVHGFLEKVDEILNKAK